MTDFVDYAFNCYTDSYSTEPATYNEAIRSKGSKLRLSAMEHELKSLHLNKIWNLVEKPAGKKIVDCKWVFRLKPELENHDKPMYKARLVAKRFSQV